MKGIGCSRKVDTDRMEDMHGPDSPEDKGLISYHIPLPKCLKNNNGLSGGDENTHTHFEREQKRARERERVPRRLFLES